MKENLFTIGEVAKIKQIHPKSLRYYESIGILTPAKIDPETKYRYYTQQQLDLVGLIQLCVDLDIPLKLLKQFSDETGNKIELAQLFAYSKTAAEVKIKKLQQSLAYLDSFEQELQQNQSLPPTAEQFSQKQEQQKQYYCVKLPGFPSITNYWLNFQTLQAEVIQAGFTKSYENGIIMRREDDQTYGYYQFIEILTTTEHQQENIFIIPAGTYTGRIIAETAVTEAENQQFFEQDPQLELLVFTEYVLGVFNIEAFSFKMKFIRKHDEQSS